MPAEVRSFEDEDLPEVAVADSSFLFEALIDPRLPGSPHEASRAFAHRLHDAGTVLVLSPLVYVEAPHCWRRLYRRGLLRPERPGLDEATTRRQAYLEASALLRDFIARFAEVVEVPFSPRLVEYATGISGYYGMDSHDSIHVAVAHLSGIPDLIGNDADFQRVDDIRVWRASPLRQA